jgi:hypothetical protein
MGSQIWPRADLLGCAANRLTPICEVSVMSPMSIRLVNNAGEIFWFTSGNWQRLLAFASRNGWKFDASLEPQNWDDSIPLNDQYEIIGGARLTTSGALALATAIERGLKTEADGATIAIELATRQDQIRKVLDN